MPSQSLGPSICDSGVPDQFILPIAALGIGGCTANSLVGTDATCLFETVGEKPLKMDLVADMVLEAVEDEGTKGDVKSTQVLGQVSGGRYMYLVELRPVAFCSFCTESWRCTLILALPAFPGRLPTYAVSSGAGQCPKQSGSRGDFCSAPAFFIPFVP